MRGVLDQELAAVFLEEARGYLGAIRDRARGKRTRQQAAHALQGAAGLVGLSALQSAAGEAERVLGAGDDVALGPVLDRLDRLLDGVADDSRTPHPDVPALDADETALLHRTFREEAHEHLEAITAALLALEQDPGRKDRLDELLRKTHTLKGSAATVGLAAVSEAAHRLEDVFAAVKAGRLPLERDGAFDELMAAADTLRALVDAIGETPLEIDALRHKLGRELAALAGVPAEATPTERSPPRRLPSESGPLTIVSRRPASEAEAGPADADAANFDRKEGRRSGERHHLRVDAARIDELMDAVGELVFDRTRIERRVQELRGVVRGLARTRAGFRGLLSSLRQGVRPEELAATLADLEDALASQVAALLRGGGHLLEDAETLRDTTTTLQKGLTGMRMTPLRQLFQRLARPLRDIAKATGKRVELITSGEETELDTAVVDQITDPLVQLLRNALAHGVERAEERVRKGKRSAGRLTLMARHQGDSVFLEVADDGAGIDGDRLRKALVFAGRMTEEEAAAASDDRVIAAIFEPGVSSREAADELAGRGIGLDVVRERIVRLGGEVSVDSTRGVGTRFTIRLPLTTAITQALLFKVAGQVYALPHAHVHETSFVEASTPELPSHIRVRDTTIPLLSLHALLGVEPPGDARRLPAVVLEFGGRPLAVTCDRVIGAREIVVKSLGPLLAPLGLYAGATISGAGKVQLILDPATLVRLAVPAEAVPETIADRKSGPLPAAGPAGGQPAPEAATARILIADDSRAVRDSLSRMLSAEGHVVDLASDGAEAWRMLGEVRYDLLVTDLEMPHLDGWQLIERVRASAGSGWEAIPIVVVSSQKTAPSRLRAVKAGASVFLAKPVTRRVLAEKVADLLRRENR